MSYTVLMEPDPIKTFLSRSHGQSSSKDGDLKRIKNFKNMLIEYGILAQNSSNHELLLNKDTTKITGYILDYLPWLVEKNIVTRSIGSAVSSLKRFYELNLVLGINWTLIKSSMPKKKPGETSGGEAYERDEIHEMIEFAYLKQKVIILLLCSAGFRPEAIARLKLGHLTDMRKAGYDTNGLDIYRIGPIWSKMQWAFPFCTPECFHAINRYCRYRINCREKLDWGDPEDLKSKQEWIYIKGSPLIRNDITPRTYAECKPVTADNVKRSITYVVKAAGIPEPKTHQEHLSRYQKRNKKQSVYGIRKFFDTTLGNAKPRINYLFKELLMGHTVKLDNSYYDISHRQSNIEILSEYLYAVADLTINDETREKAKNALKDKIILESTAETASLKERMAKLEEWKNSQGR